MFTSRESIISKPLLELLEERVSDQDERPRQSKIA